MREAFVEHGTQIVLGAAPIVFEVTSEGAEVVLSGKRAFGGLIGSSPSMREIFSLLERVAPTDFTVLIEGESGTGKELVAEAIHASSARAEGPLVVVDCSAIARDLIASELFGHTKGAFTGAAGARKGAFEAARGGTLFLDELGELPLDLQPKLLRALESREVKPVGANDTIKTDVRIVAATNRTLAHEVRAGSFREDLYYRFAVIRVALPPLRERPEDIEPLVEHFLRGARKLTGRESVEISYKTMDKLKRHKWPGNVRELKNFVERAVFARLRRRDRDQVPEHGGLARRRPRGGARSGVRRAARAARDRGGAPLQGGEEPADRGVRKIILGRAPGAHRRQRIESRAPGRRAPKERRVHLKKLDLSRADLGV